MRTGSFLYVFSALEVTVFRFIMKISVNYLCCQRQGAGVGDSCFCYYSASTRVCLVALDTEISEGLVEVVSIFIL